MKARFLAFFLAIVFLSGCVSQEELFKNRTACISLTAYSFQEIPECSSQEECFKKVEENLFNFSENSFSGSSAIALASYKNNLASSWLYFNKSLVLAKEINKACESGNFSLLPEKTNDFGFHLQKAFDFADKAALDSFSFILLEKEFLEEQGIQLMPEEKLFDDFILFNQNLNELSVPETTKNSSSYVSLYFSTSQEFNEFSSKAGFYSLYLNEFSSTDLVGFYSKDLLNLVKSKKFYVPLLKKTVSSLVSFFSSYNNLNEAVGLLEKMPSNELFSLLGNFVSSENSVAHSFSELVSNTALHKNSLKESNAQLSMQIEQKITQTSLRLDELSFSSLNEFDSNVLAFLFENLETNSVSGRQHGVESVKGFVSDSREKLFFIKNSFAELQRKQYFNEISLGETTAFLKKINSELFSLNSDADYYSGSLFDELTVLCDAKIFVIKQELNSVDFSSKPWEILSLASMVSVKISDYPKLGKEEKLLQCKEIISSFESLSLALADSNKFFLESGKSLESCLAELEAIFNSKNLPLFLDSFYSLKSVQEKLDSSYVLSSCSELKERIKDFIYSNDGEVIEINSLHADSQKTLSRLVFLNKTFPVFFPSAKVNGFKQELDSQSGHFSSGKLSVEFFADSFSMLSSIKKLNDSMHAFFVSSLEEFLSANSETKLVPLDEAVLGKEFPARQKIFFPNPLNEPVNESLSFLSPEIYGNPLLYGSCLNEITKEKNNSRIFLSCLPENGFFIESDVNYLIPFSVSSELIESSQEKIVFRKLVKVNSLFSVSRVKAVIPLEFNSEYAFAFFDSERIPAGVDSKKAVFFLNDLKPDSEIELFYSVFNPVSVVLSEKSRTKFDENTFLLEFSFLIKNNLALKFDSMDFFVPLDDTVSVKNIKLFSPVSEIPLKKVNEKIVFSSSLNEFQEKEFILKFELTDLTGYSAELKQSILSDLSLLLNSQNNETALESKKLLEAVDLVSGLAGLLGLRQKTDALLLKENSSVETEFASIKKSIEEKIDSLEKSIVFIESVGFVSEANELKSKLLKEKTALADALFLSKEKSLNSLFSINSSLEEFSEKNFEEFLLGKRDFLIKKTAGLSEQVFLLEDSGLSSLAEKISLQDNNFFSFFSGKDYFSAGVSLKLIEEQVNLFETGLKEKISEKKQFLFEKAFLLEEKKKSLELLFAETEHALAESDSYVVPITSKRLDFLKNSFSAGEKDFVFDGNSLSDLVSAEKKLIAFESELNSVESELGFALSKMKEDARVFLLSAKLSGNNDLSVAEKLFSEGKYVESINASFNAFNSNKTGLLALTGFELPLQVYPLIGVIFFIAARKLFWKKKQKRKPKKKTLLSYSEA
ncbi:MAG: hypothetical protein ABIJ74_00585 [archaeon]